VRTTLTLDEDVAAKLRAEARKTDRTFRETVNEALRRGLAAPRAAAVRRRFTVEARDLGELRAGLSLDNLGDLLERVEGPLHR
jgi:predicted transcriptional regulator